MRTVQQCGELPLAAVERAVARLQRDLDGYAAPLTDRAVAEQELATLGAAVSGGRPERAVLRQGLLLLASAVGSVRVLVPALAELRDAIDLFGAAPPPGSPGGPALHQVPGRRGGPGASGTAAARS